MCNLVAANGNRQCVDLRWTPKLDQDMTSALRFRFPWPSSPCHATATVRAFRSSGHCWTGCDLARKDTTQLQTLLTHPDPELRQVSSPTVRPALSARQKWSQLKPTPVLKRWHFLTMGCCASGLSKIQQVTCIGLNHRLQHVDGGHDWPALVGDNGGS